MKKTFSGYLKYLYLLAAASVSLNVYASPDGSSGEAMVRLSGHIPPRVQAHAVSLGALNTDEHVHAIFTLPVRNQAELEKLIQRLHNPNDEYYGKYLTSEEFIEKFAPSQEDYDKVINYAKGQGFTVTGTHDNRLLLNTSAPAGTVEKAMDITLHQYEYKGGRKFYAATIEPAVPASIAAVISGVVGLNNAGQWRTHYHQLKNNATSNASPSGPGGGFSPHDIAVAYNLTGISANGAGQSVATLQLGSYLASDINTYTTTFGLPPAKMHNVLILGGPTDPTPNGETTLDAQLVLAMAPGCDLYMYMAPNSNQGVVGAYNKMATDNIVKSISTSWGLGEDETDSQTLQTQNTIFMQMAAQGQTMYAAAGDNGAYDDQNSTLVVDDPASQPYVVGVGGTTLTVDSTTGIYLSEAVWNDREGSGGGGVSKIWPIPSWQTAVATTYSKTNRNVPDISLNADPEKGYAICLNGSWTMFGGTSCAAPLWAGFTALINQELAANQKPPLGFANPKLYALGTDPTASAQVYHDVTSGNNLFYPAGSKYDNATGWGTPNCQNLLQALIQGSTTPVQPPPQVAPVLKISMTHAGPFRKRGIGAYQINVSNTGAGQTSGPVAVTVSLPRGLTYYSAYGQGWVLSNSNQLVFTQSNILKPGASYPALTLYVVVNRQAQSLLTSSATVSGGGSASQTVTSPTQITGF